MKKEGLGVTIGSSSLRAVKLRKKGPMSYVVQRVFSERLDDTTRAVAGRALAARGFKGAGATVGLTGRDVIIRYTQVPPVPEWRLRNLMKFEVEEVGAQSGGDVSADFRRLNLPDPEGERDEDTILVALARNKHMDALIKSLDQGGLKLAAGLPSSVALFNAFAVNATYTETETSLLVNIGNENLDIAIQRGGELLFARNATPGGRAFTEAIMQAFNTSEGKAEKMKKSKGDVTPKGQAKYPDPTSEKVANAIMGVAGQMSSLIQSTLMIAKAQTRMPDLKVDRVQLAGGGATLKGLDKYLSQAMGVPVERYDPFALCDLSQLSDEDRALVEKAPHEFAVAVGLAQNEMAAEAFPLLVLPAALRRARDFATKGIWAVAAAVVMVGVLYVLYSGRNAAASEAEDMALDKEAIYKKETRRDSDLRKALTTANEALIKHELLAQRAHPGGLYSKTLSIIEGILADPKMRQVYIEHLELQVRDDNYNYSQWEPKSGKAARGYQEVSRSRKANTAREAKVRVIGRIGGGRKARDLYRGFVDGCNENPFGIVAVAPKGLEPARSNRDARFELLLYPGMVITLGNKADNTEREVVLRDVRLDDYEEDPTKLIGRRLDGVQVEIPIEDVQDRRDLVRDLQAKGPPAGAGTGEGS
ncbi:MAG: pilus assembly protein PilM [Planctomycetota bacterium]|nr:pilus assembly protein PilM [Planctomycetota bacterium]